MGVLIAGGGAGAAWYFVHSNVSDASQATGSKTTPVQPSVPESSVGPPPPLPAGFHRAKEPAMGISFPVPDGWKREVKDGGRQVNYASESELAALTINVLDFSSADQVQHFKDVEADLKVEYPSYKRLRLQGTVFQGDPAAIWEFSFMGRVREYRGIDLGFGREGDKEYAIYVSAPSANWPKYEKVFSHVKDGFRKDSPDS